MEVIVEKNVYFTFNNGNSQYCGDHLLVKCGYGNIERRQEKGNKKRSVAKQTNKGAD